MLKVLGFKKVLSLSFWQYENVKNCTLSAFQNSMVLSQKKTKSSFSRSQIEGLFFHELVESYFNGSIALHDFSTFESFINLFEMKYRASYDFNSYPVLNWSIADKSFEYLVNLQKTERSVSKLVYYPEIDISLPSMKMSGRLDMLIDKGASIEVVDYKSGAVFENGETKPQYVRQLHFYAVLAEGSLSKPVSSLSLVSLLEGRREITFNKALSEFIVNDVANTIAVLDGVKIENPLEEQSAYTLANPSIDICCYCKMRIVCKAFQSLPIQGFSSNQSFALMGTVVSIQAEQGYRFVTIVLSSSMGEFEISNIPKSMQELSVDGRFAFLNLTYVSSGLLQYNRFSQIEKYE